MNNNNKEIKQESSSREGLTGEWTRATFIAKDYKVDLFREFAKNEGRTIKWLFDDMLTDFLIKNNLLEGDK